MQQVSATAIDGLWASLSQPAWSSLPKIASAFVLGAAGSVGYESNYRRGLFITHMVCYKNCDTLYE
jgi:hypothetical protein